LPRTPGDINHILTIVFIGAGKFNPKHMGSMMRIHKNKVWQFLIWLKNNNRLYQKMQLDASVMDLYSDKDEFLPGFDEQIIYDSYSDPINILEEETAGFMSHPACPLNLDKSGFQPKVMLENMGMSDPECSRINGRTLTASALRNLVPKKENLPDLAIPRGDVIKEYNNPDLFPGMFPTLYLLGIGGFENKDREVPLGFRSQAESYFDLLDHHFHFH